MAFHRLGRGVVILLVVKMMGVVVMGMPHPDSEDDLNDCRFKDEFEVPHPFKVQLLAYINRLSPVALGFKYLDVNFGKIRDGVNLTSTEAIHSRVRDYETTENPIRLPLNIPEGWNTFRLTVAEKTLTVTLVQGKDHVDLFVLPLKDTVSIMYVDGSVARCSEASPEWAVAKGEEVNVLLQPGFSDRDQWFKVSARDSADPYIKFPSAMSTRTLVPANTTLKVTTILRGDHVLLRVFKTGENSDEEVARGNATLTLPWKLVVGGGSHVRLTLFSAPATPADLPTRTYSIASIVPYLEGACGMLAVVVVVVLVLRLKKRLKRNKKNENKKDGVQAEECVTEYRPRSV